MIDSFLAELGKRFAERWFTALVVPGLLLVAAGWCAVVLGHGHALDLPYLVRTTRSRLSGLHLDAVATVVLAVAILLLAAAAAGLVQVLSRLVQRLWLLERRHRSVISVGRRLRRLDERIQAEYHGLRIGLVWPRLWLLLADTQRSIVQTTLGAILQAALLTGWGLLYLTLGVWWWPGLLIGAVHLAIAWTSARTQTVAYATLVESLIDINQRELATALGIDLPHGVITEPEAGQINARLRKTGPA
jgi:hypothetical protein